MNIKKLSDSELLSLKHKIQQQEDFHENRSTVLKVLL